MPVVWKRDLAFCVLGVVLSSVVGPPTADLMNWSKEQYRDKWCGAEQHLVAGRRWRRQAVDLDIEIKKGRASPDKADQDVFTLHYKANSEFETASECGSPEAKAQLGLAYCSEWGVPKDHGNRGKGLALMREAWKDDPRIAEWVLDAHFCP